MIQQEYKNNIADMSGDITSTGFTIEANASVYAMLTQNVYNDPILAVVREWSTNACDACLAAEVPVEYDVHLPTPSDPNFYVRDYGTGLPPEDIIGLFSNLGASTKRNSDLYNGTLGIGRMAGLAVADSFSVESYYEGMLYSYVISMQDGIPVTLHLGNTPTTERNGLKLSVAVENRSFSFYAEKANAIYKYFDYKPNINDQSIDMEIKTEDRISDDWFIQQDSSGSYYYNHENFIVMSQVVYTIPRNSELKTHDFRQLVLKAPAGAVTFNPGRESLTLDRKTITYLNNAFEKVKDDYVTKGTTALAACDDDRELIKCYSNVVKAAPRGIASKIDPVPFMSQELQNLVVKNYGINLNVQKTDLFTTDTSHLVQLTSKPSYYKTARELDSRNSVSVQDFFSAKHVIIDMKTKYKTLLNQHYKDNLVVFWQRAQGDDMDLAVAEAKRYLEALAISYELASTIAASVPADEKATILRQGFYASVIGPHGKIYKSKAMSTEDITKNDYLCLPLNHSTPLLKDSSTSFSDYLALYNHLRQNGTVPEVLGVPKKYQGYVDDLDNWTDFETYIKEQIATYSYNIDSASFEGSIPRGWSKEDFEDYPETIRQFHQNLSEYHEFCASKNYVCDGWLQKLLKKFGAAATTFKPVYLITADTIKETYPLTYKTLFASHYMFEHSTYSRDEAKRLAKLEEFYAIHSTE